jgi:hypothetical protein
MNPKDDPADLPHHAPHLARVEDEQHRAAPTVEGVGHEEVLVRQHRRVPAPAGQVLLRRALERARLGPLRPRQDLPPPVHHPCVEDLRLVPGDVLQRLDGLGREPPVGELRLPPDGRGEDRAPGLQPCHEQTLGLPRDERVEQAKDEQERDRKRAVDRALEP